MTTSCVPVETPSGVHDHFLSYFVGVREDACGSMGPETGYMAEEWAMSWQGSKLE
jgi:hypothetical protein